MNILGSYMLYISFPDFKISTNIQTTPKRNVLSTEHYKEQVSTHVRPWKFVSCRVRGLVVSAVLIILLLFITNKRSVMAGTMLTRQYFVYVRLAALNYIPCRNLRPVVRKVKSSTLYNQFPSP